MRNLIPQAPPTRSPAELAHGYAFDAASLLELLAHGTAHPAERRAALAWLEAGSEHREHWLLHGPQGPTRVTMGPVAAAVVRHTKQTRGADAAARMLQTFTGTPFALARELISACLEAGPTALPCERPGDRTHPPVQPFRQAAHPPQTR